MATQGMAWRLASRYDACIATVRELHNACIGLPLENLYRPDGVNEVMGNSPYGASTIAAGDGNRTPSNTQSG
jgi:hypothetical protein